MRAARTLLGCYRSGQANDPEIYITAVVKVLSAYPVDVGHAISDPLTGLPSRLQWLPTVAEVKAACENLIPGPFHDSRQHAIAAQLEERARLEKFHADNQPKETWEQTKADLIARGFRLEGRQTTFETADQIMAKHGITAEQWAAVPDLPPDFEERATRRARG